MQKVTKEVGTREEVLGTLVFSVCDNLSEAISVYGEGSVLNLFNRSIQQDMERVARENFKKDGATQESVQALVDNYRPGARTAKPTMKNFQELITQFVEADQVEMVLEAHRIYKNEDLEAAYNFLMEKKGQGALNG